MYFPCGVCISPLRITHLSEVRDNYRLLFLYFHNFYFRELSIDLSIIIISNRLYLYISFYSPMILGRVSPPNTHPWFFRESIGVWSLPASPLWVVSEMWACMLKGRGQVLRFRSFKLRTTASSSQAASLSLYDSCLFFIGCSQYMSSACENIVLRLGLWEPELE